MHDFIKEMTFWSHDSLICFLFSLPAKFAFFFFPSSLWVTKFTCRTKLDINGILMGPAITMSCHTHFCVKHLYFFFHLNCSYLFSGQGAYQVFLEALKHYENDYIVTQLESTDTVPSRAGIVKQLESAIASPPRDRGCEFGCVCRSLTLHVCVCVCVCVCVWVCVFHHFDLLRCYVCTIQFLVVLYYEVDWQL